MDISEVFQKLRVMENVSIYDGTRVAQPDEVWNYGRGDGLEKALCMMNIIRNRHPQENLRLKGDGKTVLVSRKDGAEYAFESSKGLELPREEDFFF